MAESEKNTGKTITEDEEAKKRADGGTGDADGGTDGTPENQATYKKLNAGRADDDGAAKSPAPTAPRTVEVEEPVPTVELGRDGDNDVPDLFF